MPGPSLVAVSPSGHRLWVSVVEQSLSDRVANELGASRDAQLLHDVGAMSLGGPDRDEELLRNLLVRMAVGEQPKHLALAARERIFLGSASGLGLGLDQSRTELRMDVAASARHLA